MSGAVFVIARLLLCCQVHIDRTVVSAGIVDLQAQLTLTGNSVVEHSINSSGIVAQAKATVIIENFIRSNGRAGIVCSDRRHQVARL